MKRRTLFLAVFFSVSLLLGAVIARAEEVKRWKSGARIHIVLGSWITGLHGDGLDWGKDKDDDKGEIELVGRAHLYAWWDHQQGGDPNKPGEKRVVAIKVGNQPDVRGKHAPAQLGAPDIDIEIPEHGEIEWTFGTSRKYGAITGIRVVR